MASATWLYGRVTTPTLQQSLLLLVTYYLVPSSHSFMRTRIIFLQSLPTKRAAKVRLFSELQSICETFFAFIFIPCPSHPYAQISPSIRKRLQRYDCFLKHQTFRNLFSQFFLKPYFKRFLKTLRFAFSHTPLTTFPFLPYSLSGCKGTIVFRNAKLLTHLFLYIRITKATMPLIYS